MKRKMDPMQKVNNLNNCMASKLEADYLENVYYP